MADEEDTVDTEARLRPELCERHSRLALIAHLRERIALGQLGGEAQLRAVARSPRLLEELADRDVDGGCWQ